MLLLIYYSQAGSVAGVSVRSGRQNMVSSFLFLSCESCLTSVCDALIGQREVLSGDCSNGFGKKLYTNGAMYEGQYQNGTRHGRGVYILPDGGIFDGDWVDVRPVGADWVRMQLVKMRQTSSQAH